MDTITFDKLLLKTAFCCMAADGKIDNREISKIKTICENSPLFENFHFQNEINNLVAQINSRGKEFIQNYFNLLDKSELTEQEELTILDFAIQTINADEEVEYSEIKFFKNIRHRLKVKDEVILKSISYPDIELYLEEDIVTDGFLEKITKQFLQSSDFPQFDVIKIDLPTDN